MFYWVQSLLGNIIMSLSFGTLLEVLVKNKFLPSPTVVYIVFKLFFVDFIDCVLSTTAKV